MEINSTSIVISVFDSPAFLMVFVAHYYELNGKVLKNEHFLLFHFYYFYLFYFIVTNERKGPFHLLFGELKKLLLNGNIVYVFIFINRMKYVLVFICFLNTGTRKKRGRECA